MSVNAWGGGFTKNVSFFGRLPLCLYIVFTIINKSYLIVTTYVYGRLSPRAFIYIHLLKLKLIVVDMVND